VVSLVSVILKTSKKETAKTTSLLKEVHLNSINWGDLRLSHDGARRIAVILTAYEGMPLLPFEIRPLTYDARNVLESLSRIETNLLMLCLKQAALNKAVSYLWDANFRLEEGDIEGARVSVRNSLQVLLDEFIPVIEVREESEKFPEKLKGLINKLREFARFPGGA
jgi:hypothetical protein